METNIVILDIETYNNLINKIIRLNKEKENLLKIINEYKSKEGDYHDSWN